LKNTWQADVNIVINAKNVLVVED